MRRAIATLFLLHSQLLSWLPLEKSRFLLCPQWSIRFTTCSPSYAPKTAPKWHGDVPLLSPLCSLSASSCYCLPTPCVELSIAAMGVLLSLQQRYQVSSECQKEKGCYQTQKLLEIQTWGTDSWKSKKGRFLVLPHWIANITTWNKSLDYSIMLYFLPFLVRHYYS